MKKRAGVGVILFCLAVFITAYTSVAAAVIPSDILAPVVGDLEIVSSATQCSNTKWCFNQHRTGNHVQGGGICQSDDTFAWDANLNYPVFDSDAGKPVYAVAVGFVAQTYGGCINAGGSFGQLLIQHESEGTTWWSGYLHMRNIQVVLGQSVDQNTILGYVSNVGVDDNKNHLHFVVYKGQNTQTGLVSFNPNIIPIGIFFQPSLEGRTIITDEIFTITIFNPGTQTIIAKFTTKPSDSITGAFVLPSSVSIPPGVYDILVHSPGYLKKRANNIAFSSEVTIHLPTLMAGDFNNDNVINSIDWLFMSNVWFTSDPITDIDGNGTVNSIDFGYLNKNWGKTGDN